MTNEEAIKLLLESKDNNIERSSREWEEWDKRYFEAIDKAIEALKQTIWIPCSEKLPTKVEDYLCQESQGFQYVDLYLGDGKWRIADYNFGRVVAWRPLSKPYEEVNEDE